MSKENDGGESLFDLPQPERTIRIAEALGADVVYNVTNAQGEKPELLDYILGSVRIDRLNPIFVKESQENTDNG